MNASASHTVPSGTSAHVGETPGVDAEVPITLVDVGFIAVILVTALWYLYRQLWSKRGSHGGCSSGQGGTCSKRPSTASSPDQQPRRDTRIPVSQIRKHSS